MSGFLADPFVEKALLVLLAAWMTAVFRVLRQISAHTKLLARLEAQQELIVKTLDSHASKLDNLQAMVSKR